MKSQIYKMAFPLGMCGAIDVLVKEMQPSGKIVSVQTALITEQVRLYILDFDTPFEAYQFIERSKFVENMWKLAGEIHDDFMAGMPVFAQKGFNEKPI